MSESKMFTAWLIERDGDGQTEYIGPGYEWVADANKAIKFVTRHDAEKCSECHDFGEFQIEEHGWPDGP